MELVNIKYVGDYAVLAQIPAWGKGLVRHGDIVQTTKENWEKELKNNHNWKLEEETIKSSKKNKIEEAN